ncbi:MAG: B12-binding domain-containing protein [Desulfopila sp.]
MNERHGVDRAGHEDDKQHATLVQRIADLDEQGSISSVLDLLAEGCNPQSVLESCFQGMREVGTRFEEGRYFIAALIMAGEIMHQITNILEPSLSSQQKDSTSGTLLLGTVAGDFHDLGKNLFAILARCYGIEVVDLGVNVKGSIFLQKALEIKPDIIGISCILSVCWENLEKTVKLLHKELPQPQPAIIIGGASVDRRIARYVKSDYWVRDASEGVNYCLEVMQKSPERVDH